MSGFRGGVGMSVKSEEDLVRLSESVITAMHVEFCKKPELHYSAVLEMCMNIEEEIFKKAVYDTGCRALDMWKTARTVGYYSDYCNKCVHNLKSKDMDWKKFFDKKDAKLQMDALYRDEGWGKGNIFKRRKSNKGTVVRKSYIPKSKHMPPPVPGARGSAQGSGAVRMQLQTAVHASQIGLGLAGSSSQLCMGMGGGGHSSSSGMEMGMGSMGQLGGGQSATSLSMMDNASESAMSPAMSPMSDDNSVLEWPLSPTASNSMPPGGPLANVSSWLVGVEAGDPPSDASASVATGSVGASMGAGACGLAAAAEGTGSSSLWSQARVSASQQESQSQSSGPNPDAMQRAMVQEELRRQREGALQASTGVAAVEQQERERLAALKVAQAADVDRQREEEHRKRAEELAAGPSIHMNSSAADWQDGQ